MKWVAVPLIKDIGKFIFASSPIDVVEVVGNLSKCEHTLQEAYESDTEEGKALLYIVSIVADMVSTVDYISDTQVEMVGEDNGNI